MRSKRKFKCDYCCKLLVSSKIYKLSHQNTVGHKCNVGRYYNPFVLENMDRELTCAHLQVSNCCKYGDACNERFYVLTTMGFRYCYLLEISCRKKTQLSKESQIGSWEAFEVEERDRLIQASFEHRLMKHHENKVKEAIKITINKKKNLKKLPPSLLPTAYFYGSQKMMGKYFKNTGMTELFKLRDTAEWGRSD